MGKKKITPKYRTRQAINCLKRFLRTCSFKSRIEVEAKGILRYGANSRHLEFARTIVLAHHCTQLLSLLTHQPMQPLQTNHHLRQLLLSVPTVVWSSWLGSLHRVWIGWLGSLHRVWASWLEVHAGNDTISCNHIVIKIPIFSWSLMFVCILVAMTSKKAGCLPVVYNRNHTKKQLEA